MLVRQNPSVNLHILYDIGFDTKVPFDIYSYPDINSVCSFCKYAMHSNFLGSYLKIDDTKHQTTTTSTKNERAYIFNATHEHFVVVPTYSSKHRTINRIRHVFHIFVGCVDFGCFDACKLHYLAVFSLIRSTTMKIFMGFVI